MTMDNITLIVDVLEKHQKQIDNIQNRLIQADAESQSQKNHIVALVADLARQSQQIASLQDRVNKLSQRKGGHFTLKLVESDDD